MADSRENNDDAVAQADENAMIYFDQENQTEDKDTTDSKEANVDAVTQADEQAMPSFEQEEAAVKKKYGGMMPKKPPLIAKDHEKAFFDSADWALGKGTVPGLKSRSPMEALRPKLQPTPHQPLPTRKDSYDPPQSEDGSGDASEERT